MRSRMFSKRSEAGAFGGATSLSEDTRNTHMLTASLDIGTGFSGYAFAFNAEPLQIYMNKNWTEVTRLSNNLPQ